MKVCFVLNSPDYFISHRLPIAIALLEKGYEVHVVASGDCPTSMIDYGIKYHPIHISRKGMNPFSELSIIVSLYRLFRTVRPDIVHLVTIKPCLYGGIAARLAQVPAVVSAVAGLGIVFSTSNFKYKVLRLLLYPLFYQAFSHTNQKVIFQNTDDRDLLIKWGVVTPSKSLLVRGAGVDLSSYTFVPEPNGVPVISFAARLLKDKGVQEFVEASKLLQERGVKAEFWLIGSTDPGNSNTVTNEQLLDWEMAGLVKCLGYRKDVHHLFSKSNIVSLPSYYGEGLPKVLVEAAACGRAVITTDHPGCRDAIESNISGLLVPVRCASALADAIECLIENDVLRKGMGQEGRLLAEREFSIDHIVAIHIDVYQELLDN